MKFKNDINFCIGYLVECINTKHNPEKMKEILVLCLIEIQNLKNKEHKK